MISTNEGLSIGEAAQLNLSEDTLRYYERIGLTPPVERASRSSPIRRAGPDMVRIRDAHAPHLRVKAIKRRPHTALDVVKRKIERIDTGVSVNS